MVAKLRATKEPRTANRRFAKEPGAYPGGSGGDYWVLGGVHQFGRARYQRAIRGRTPGIRGRSGGGS